MITIGEFTLEGGGACPEQYDVTRDGKTVGYFRLRHGRFTAKMLNSATGEWGVTLFEAFPRGDGGFYDGERMGFLEDACDALRTELARVKGQVE